MRPDELPDDPEVDALLRHLDHPPPSVTARQVIERARGRGGHRLRWAAGILLAMAVAGAAANAAPGSPMRGWISDTRRALGLGPEPALPTTPAVAAPQGSSGIALDPGSALQIVFAESAGGGYARIEMTDEPQVQVRASAGSTRFVTEPDRLLVEHTTADTVVVVVPRSSAFVEIVAGGRSALLKRGAEVTAPTAAQVGDVWLIPLGPGGR